MPAKPIKVLHVLDRWRIGGAERQLAALLASLHGESVENHLLLFAHPDHRLMGLNELPVKIHVHERKTAFDPGVFIFLLRTLRDIRPDIIHAWSNYEATISFPIAKLSRISTLYGAIRNARTMQGKFRLAEQVVMRTFSTVILSNSQAGLNARVPKNLHSKSCVIPNGLEIERFCAPRGEMKASGEKILTISMIAQFNEKKDQFGLLRVLKSMAPELPPCRVILPGDGKTRANAVRFAGEHFTPGMIEFPGQVDDVLPVLSESDIFIHLSTRFHQEGQPNSVMEAMAAGLPVIATDSGGTREVLTDEVEGMLVPPGDEKAVADALRSLISDPLRRSKLGNNARERAEREFSIEKMVERYLDLYRQMTGL